MVPLTCGTLLVGDGKMTSEAGAQRQTLGVKAIKYLALNRDTGRRIPRGLWNGLAR